MPAESENDFDLYNILKQMKTSRPKIIVSKTKLNFDKQKTLTAAILDSHYTDGYSEWSSFESKIDLYRTKIPSIGTSIKDLGPGESIFFDFEPLSTRLKLMCKLIIIIQGAVYERSGPPKLVQDRSVQFPEISDNNLKLKSTSCENLLEEVKLPYMPEPKMIVFNSRLKRSNSRLAEKRIRNRSITSNCLSDEESSGSNVEEISLKHYDTEHYFKFRLSGYAKDYVSLPYYQYSSFTSRYDHKSTETFDDRIKNQYTSTDDLIPEADLGYFSKKQLLSSSSLFEKKTWLKNSETCAESINERLYIPIDIQPIPKLARVDSDLETYEFNEKMSYETRRPGCLIEENSTEIFRVEKTKPKTKLLDTFDENLFERLRMGPKKSSEWGVFSNINNRPISKTVINDLGSKGFVTTRTTTVTTTTTSSTTSTTEITKSIDEHEIN